MYQCPDCHAQFRDPLNFCTACGTPMASEPQREVIPPANSASRVCSPHQATAQGFGDIFGLHPACAVFTIAVNVMLFGGGGVVAVLVPGAGIPIALMFSLFGAVLVSYVTYLGQMKWYGDDHQNAKLKCIISGGITFIPTNVPGILFGGIALAGLLRRKKS